MKKHATRLLLSAALALSACHVDERPGAGASPPLVPPASAPPQAAAASPGASADASAPARAPTAARREAAAELVLAPGGAAAVVPPLAAQLLALHVRPGDRVEVGAPIATARVPEAAAAAVRATTAAERLALVEERLAAVDALLAAGLARSADRADVAARAAELRAERAVALTALTSAGLGGAAALAASGGRVVLRAPAAGVVTEVAAAVGEVRGPADPPLARISGGGATRVMARWASAQDLDRPASLWAGDERRRLRQIAMAPRPEGGVSVWYDIEGEPVPAVARARVVLEGAP